MILKKSVISEYPRQCRTAWPGRAFSGVTGKGFTLTELVITIILIGIMSAVVINNINAKARHGVTTQSDIFRRDLSRIQLMAISQGKRLRLSVGLGGYTVYECPDAACASPVTVATDTSTGQPFVVTLTDAAFTASSTLEFDSLGRPQSGGSLVTVVRSYTLSGNGRSVSVTVLPITGFAQTSY